MRKLTKTEMEDIAVERIYSTLEMSDYKKGVLDTYLRIYGTSKGIREYLHDELGKDLIGFLEEVVLIKENGHGEYYLLDL